MSQNNENDLILEKILKSTKQLNPEDVEAEQAKPTVKESADDWLRKEFERNDFPYPIIETTDNVSKEDPITVMFNKARKGTL